MLTAFTARPLVELKQRDKSRIESVLAYGDRLLVGLNTGSLRIYRVNEIVNEQKEDQNGDDASEPRPPSRSESRPVDLLREQEKFSKYKIEQLALVKEANLLLSLSNGYIHLHDLQDYSLQETLTKSKGASTFAVTSNVIRDPSSGVNSIVTKLAVAVKRRLLIWSWHDGELEANISEQTLVTGIKTLTWATETRLVAGLNANYVLVDVETSSVIDIVGPGSIGGAADKDGGRLGATGVAGMSYLGMTAPKPLATHLGFGEILLARDINTHFIDTDATSIGRRQVPWPVAPDAVGYSYPYLLALQAARGILELRNPRTLTLLQSIPLPAANQLHIPQTNTSLAHAGKGFLVLSERAIWQMQAHEYDSQIDQLVDRGLLDEAISLLDMLEDALLKDKSGRMREIKMQKAQRLFDEKKFREAIDLFTEVSAPPEKVISLYPPFIAGDASSSISHQHGSASPPGSPRSVKSAKGSIKESEPEGIASRIKHSILPSLHGDGDKNHNSLEGKDLKVATEELRGFLVQSRTRMKRVLNPDGTLKREGFDNITTSDFNTLLVKNTFDQSNDQDSILETAKLIDTTLFRAYMFVSPFLAGPLFRIDNFCDPDVVQEKLTEVGRYDDLVDFLRGKNLHRQALELLQKFGRKRRSSDAAAAPQLAGPQRSVTYLLNLSAEHIDLILEFAKWPLEKDPELGMQIFLADSENAETLPRDRVFSFLQSMSQVLGLQYLEHIINELNDTTPTFHQTLAEIYIALLGDSSPDPDPDIEKKTLAFLKTSKAYTPYKILSLLPLSNPVFYEPRAIVLSNMGQHRQALDIYVFKLQSPEKAEEYCNSVYLASLPSSNAPPATLHTSHSPTSLSADDSNQTNIYTLLLSLYLNPPRDKIATSTKTQKNDVSEDDHKNWPAALSLLAAHGARMPASSTLHLMPSGLPVREVQKYWRGQMRSQYSAAAEARIVAGLRASEGVRVEHDLRLGEEEGELGAWTVGLDSGTGGIGKRKLGRRRRVLIEEDRVCGVCYRRFGGSAVKVLPDGGVVHYGCAVR